MKKEGATVRTLIILLVFMAIVTVIPIPVSASNNYIYGDGKTSAYSIRLDSPHFSGDVYHVHFYKKSKHLYCMRLDNLQPCDKKNSDKSSVPEWLMNQAMNDSRVQNRIKDYNPSLASNSGLIKGLVVAGAAVLVILAALNIFAGPADDMVAWGLLLRALAG